MATCVPRSKQPDDDDGSNRYGDTPAGKQSMKTLTSQIKEMAIKASGAYRSCSPCARPRMMMSQEQQLERSNDAESCSSASVFSERFRRRNGSSGRVWGKEMEARLKAISIGSGGVGEASGSGRRSDPVVLTEEIEPKEWVAQVEPGILITFISLPRGANHLKRIRFSREMFSKWQAQRWWQENFDKVMELYNVRRLNRQAFPLPTPPKSEHELAPNSRSSKIESLEDSPLAPTLRKERQPYTIQLDHQGSTSMTSNSDSIGLAVTPKLLSISGTKTKTKTKTSSLDASKMANWSREVDCNEELSISKVGDVDNEWVEQDEPGVYITIKVLPGGSRELKRVRFSREKFGEVHARLWWEENRARIQKQYL